MVFILNRFNDSLQSWQNKICKRFNRRRGQAFWRAMDNKMVGCVYTSESRALALLEYTVNINIDDIPRALSVTSIDIPDQFTRILNEADLPRDWRHSPAPSSTKKFGSGLLLAAAEAVIRIPSIVIPGEFNYLLNPLHAKSREFKIINIIDFVYDVRIKTS